MYNFNLDLRGRRNMYLLRKKLIVAVIVLILLFSGSLTMSAASFEGELSTNEQNIKLTLYRYGPDGSIQLVPAEIELVEGQDLEPAVLEKCSELVDNDVEIQNFIFGNDTQINVSILSRVKSWGRGFHWKSPIGFRIPFPFLLRYRIFTLLKPRYMLFGINVIPRVVCNYSDDEEAWTEITPLPLPSRQNVETIRYEGNHSVWALNFIGYTGWWGMNAEWIDSLGKRTGFDGYAYFTLIIRNKVD